MTRACAIYTGHAATPEFTPPDSRLTHSMNAIAKYSRFSALFLAAMISQSSLSAAEKTVVSFESDEVLKAWTSVNDGVMGGISKGGFTRSEQGTLLFRGELSLENNGGFASIRLKQTELDLSGTNTLVIKAKGDGRTCKSS